MKGEKLQQQGRGTSPTAPQGQHQSRESAVSYTSRTEVKSINSLPNVKHLEIAAG